MTSEAGPSTRGDFVASTIDVDAIKVSKYLCTIKQSLKLFLKLQRSPERFERSRKEPLMTIPDDWATFEPPLHDHPKKTHHHESEDESEESDSNESDSNFSESSESGSCSSCSTCSNTQSDDSSDSSSTMSDVTSKTSAANKSKQHSKSINKSRFMAFKSNKSQMIHMENNSESLSSPLKPGFISQAETCKQKQSKQKVNVNKSSVNSANSTSMRKFFKRKQQQNLTVRRTIFYDPLNISFLQKG